MSLSDRALLGLAVASLSFASFACEAQTGARPAVTPPATAIGEVQSCIPVPHLRDALIRDDWTIDFVGNGLVWRNALPSRCPGLRANNAFTYETSLSELCSADSIFVAGKAGLPRGPACALGKFVPVALKR